MAWSAGPATTPRSAPGSEVTPCPGRLGARGFTLIELMVVVALIAIAAGVVSLSLNDPADAHLEREAARLSALLEAARTEVAQPRHSGPVGAGTGGA